MKKVANDVDTYIATAPKEARGKLVQLRKIIKASAPNAEEGVSYRMPYYKYHGPLAYFAAFKNHIGLFIPPPIIEEYKRELKAYETAKSTVRFPINKPLPATLIKRLVKARAIKNETRKLIRTG